MNAMETDIIILDATRNNVAPLNQVPGAWCRRGTAATSRPSSSPGRSAGGRALLNLDLPGPRRQLDASRD